MHVSQAPSTFIEASDWINYIGTLKTSTMMGKEIVILNLSSQNLTDNNIIALAEVLKDDNKIWRLDLSDNQIGDIGAKALANALKTNEFICTNIMTDSGNLNLFNNPIEKAGYKAIINAVKETQRPPSTIGIDQVDLGLVENIYNLKDPIGEMIYHKTIGSVVKKGQNCTQS